MNLYCDDYQKYIKYKTKYLKLKNSIQQKGGYDSKNLNSIWIEENFFSEKEFSQILDDIKNCKLKDDERSSNRKTMCLSKLKYKNLYDRIYKNCKFTAFIDSIKDNNCKLKLEPSFPIEYRKYFTGSQGMSWHRDLSMFEPDCFEIVLTLTNNSDSKFEWMENNKVKSILPKANTLVAVRPESILHRVSPINYGERTILKFIIEFIKDGMNDNIKKSELFDQMKKCPF